MSPENFTGVRSDFAYATGDPNKVDVLYMDGQLTIVPEPTLLVQLPGLGIILGIIGYRKLGGR